MSQNKFRTDISFLRALAVIAVIFFHFKINFFTGGLLGVDIFFVISGYLMTMIILSKFSTHSFKLLDFYKRRVQRIIPALLFIIIILTLFSFAFLKPDIKQFFRYAFVSELFISNLFYLRNSGYFDNASQNNILLHSWTLSVEWQFYMIYPIVLILFRRIYFRWKKWFLLIFSVATLISLLLMLYYSDKDSAFSFYSLLTRAWEMLVGGLVYLLNPDRKRYLNQNWRIFTSIICFLSIASCIILIKENDVWPSYYTLIPVFSTATLIFLDTNFKLYNSRFIKFTGDISYSLYLWHWPLFVIFQYFGVVYNYVTIIALIILSYIFASISYFLIERNRKAQNVWTILVVVFVLAGTHYYLFKEGVDNYILSEPEFKNEISWDSQTREDIGCNLDLNGNGIYSKTQCLSIDKTSKNILLIGDSHAGSIALSLEEAFHSKNINLLQMTFTGDTPNLFKNNNPKLNTLSTFLFEDFLPTNRNHIQLVIVSLYYSNRKNVFEDLKSIKAYLDKLNIPVLFVGENETYKLHYSKIQQLKERYPKFINENNYLLLESKTFNTKLNRKYPDNYLDIYNNLQKSNQDNLYMFDTNHFTKWGADQVTKFIMRSEIMDQVVQK